MQNHPLLLDEPPLLIRPTLACVLAHAGLRPGDRQALWTQQLNYWIQFHRKGGHRAQHYRDGRWWVWNSVREWLGQFPFWSRSTMERVIERSIAGGVTLKANYNPVKYDRTLWYTIDYDRLQALTVEWENTCTPFRQNEEMETVSLPLFISSDRGNGDPQTEDLDSVSLQEPIPETTREDTDRENTERSTAEAGDVVSGLDEIGIGEPVRSELAGVCPVALVSGWVEWWKSGLSDGLGVGWVVTQLRAGLPAPVVGGGESAYAEFINK
jgi:hypothetical protein